MILFLVSIILLILFLYVIWAFLDQFNLPEKLVLVFLISSAYLVILLELSGLMNSIRKPLIILLIQFVFTGIPYLFIIIGKRRFVRFSFSELKDGLKGLIALIRRNKALFFYSLPILLTYLFLIFIEVRFPQSTTDSLYNHLSRVGYWLQQGNLSPYSGFNNLGTTYPYNNSLLMLWSVTFLRSDVLVGLVQFFAALTLSITVYLTGVTLGFSRKGSYFSAALFLTFPIILFESITAQNDILVATFLVIAFYFLLKYARGAGDVSVIVSILAYSLAIGTKQNAFFALPGYFFLYLYAFFKNKGNLKRTAILSITVMIIFGLTLGSYTYLQNWFTTGTPLPPLTANILEPVNAQGSIFKKISINSARLVYQFLACEGIPPQGEALCIKYKASIFKPLLVNKVIDVESTSFLLDQNGNFQLDRRYSLNEESAWFGLQGWLIIIPGSILGLARALKRKKKEILLLLVTVLSFFLITAVFKKGWDPYVGRYLIFSAALLVPITAALLDHKGILLKIFLSLVSIFSIFSMLYCVANNDSRPLISKNIMADVYKWGGQHSKLVQKVTYKLTPYVRHVFDFWSLSDITLETSGNSGLAPVLEVVETASPQPSTLGILARSGLFPDYLFFGDHFERTLFPMTEFGQLASMNGRFEYLLVSPDFSHEIFTHYFLLADTNGWRFFKQIK